jgi:hypothetical protein
MLEPIVWAFFKLENPARFQKPCRYVLLKTYKVKKDLAGNELTDKIALLLVWLYF